MKRNHEWPQAAEWNGYFTQDQSGGVTERVDPSTVESRLTDDGFTQITKLIYPMTSGTITLEPNTRSTFGTLETVSFLLMAAGNPARQNEYSLTFTVGASTMITWPAGIVWEGATAPPLVVGKVYEVSIQDGRAVYGEFSA